MNIDLKEIRQNIGISLIFTGVTLSMYLKYFVSDVPLSPVIMLLSCVLLCDKDTFRNNMNWNRGFRFLFLFQLFMIFYLFLFFNDQSDTTIPKQLSFHLYILALIFIFGHTPSLWNRNYIPYLLIISSLLSIVGLTCHLLDLFELDRMLHKGENSVLEVFTANIAAYASFICCMLMMEIKKKKEFLLLIIIIAIDLFVIIESGKRSYFVAVIASVMLYLYKKQRLGQGIVLLIVSILILFVFIPEFQEMVITIADRTISGFSDVYVSQSSVTDWNDSASLRVFLQKQALQKFYDFNLLNVVFGGGYYCQFFDNPLAESYLDMGFIGLLSYFYIIVLFPFTYIIKFSSDDKKEILPFFLALMNICIIITNNSPYIYLAYTPICVMSMYLFPTISNNE